MPPNSSPLARPDRAGERLQGAPARGDLGRPRGCPAYVEGAKLRNGPSDAECMKRLHRGQLDVERRRNVATPKAVRTSRCGQRIAQAATIAWTWPSRPPAVTPATRRPGAPTRRPATPPYPSSASTEQSGTLDLPARFLGRSVEAWLPSMPEPGRRRTGRT